MDKDAFYDFEFGILRIKYIEESVTSFQRVRCIDAKDEPSELSDRAFLQVQEYFAGIRKYFDFPYELFGTEFQKKVWKALTEIPYGETRTYKEIAIGIGNAKACRAVGMANNKNPLFIAVPCHRVIGANGKLVGYAGGLEMKKALLELEARYK